MHLTALAADRNQPYLLARRDLTCRRSRRDPGSRGALATASSRRTEAALLDVEYAAEPPRENLARGVSTAWRAPAGSAKHPDRAVPRTVFARVLCVTGSSSTLSA